MIPAIRPARLLSAAWLLVALATAGPALAQDAPPTLDANAPGTAEAGAGEPGAVEPDAGAVDPEAGGEPASPGPAGAEASPAAPAPAEAVEPGALAVRAKGTALAGGGVDLVITVPDTGAAETPVTVYGGERVLGTFRLAPGEHEVEIADAGLGAGRHEVRVELGEGAEVARPPRDGVGEVRTVPGWLSVVPPVIAIGLALVFKDVLISLFLGVFAGALILFDWNPIAAFARSIDHFILSSLADADQAKIILFTTLLGGMVGVISRSGGTLGIVERLTPYATTSRRGQLATWVLGVLVFFDDYANTLIVGSTMRPITDRLRISREKLAYIVDSTAAPVASVVPISTWIGFEVGLIGAAFTDLGLGLNPFTAFVGSIPYRFYPLLALVLGFTIAASGRDFGPMLRAERRARDHGHLMEEGDQPLADYRSEAMEPPQGIPLRAFNAVAPIVTVVVVTLAGLYVTGSAAVAAMDAPPEAGSGTWWREVFAQSDSFTTLLWAALAGLVLAIVLPLVQRLLSVRQTMEATVEGFKAMLLALVVLVLAWSIGSVCSELHTADWVVSVAEGVLSPHWLPVLVFLISAAVAFSTGTSWGTMGILVPLVIPIAHGLATNEGMAVGDGSYGVILLGTISSVLAGSVWGDHCSPISDTTILSSTASGSDHIAHVRTQLPYALGIGVLGMLIGDIPTAYGMSPWVSLLVGTVVIVGGVLWLGKKSA